MNSDFTDITITDLDAEQTRQSDTAPGLRQMVLTLSAQPTAEWTQIFEAERQFPRHSMWRRAWIEGPAIVIDCVPEELEKYHLRDLQQDVANTNQKYREFLTKVEAQNQREKKAREEEDKRLNELKKRLKF